MKTKILSILTLLVIFSCSKKEENTVEIDSELVGKWQVIGVYDDVITQEEIDSGLNYEIIENGRIIEFKNDGKHINILDGCDFGMFTSDLDQNELFFSCEDEILNDYPFYIYLRDNGDLSLSGSEFGGEILSRVTQ